MGVLRRLREVGSLYFVLLGCVATSFYFLLLNNFQTTNNESSLPYYDNLSRTNFQYEEICRYVTFEHKTPYSKIVKMTF